MNDKKGLVVLKIISIISVMIVIIYTTTGFISDKYEDLLIGKIQSIVKDGDDVSDKESIKKVKKDSLQEDEDDDYIEDDEEDYEEDYEDIEDQGEDEEDIEDEENSEDTESYEEVDEEVANDEEGTENIEKSTAEVSNGSTNNENKDTTVENKVETPTVNVEQVSYPRIVKNNDGTLSVLRSKDGQANPIMLDGYANGFWEFNYNYCVIAPQAVQYSIEFECNGKVETATGSASVNMYKRYVNGNVKNNDKLNIKLTAKINGTEETTSFQKTIYRGLFGFRD